MFLAVAPPVFLTAQLPSMVPHPTTWLLGQGEPEEMGEEARGV